MNIFAKRLLLCGVVALLGAGEPNPSLKLVTYGTGMGAWCLYAAQQQHYFDAAGVTLDKVFSIIGDPAIVSALTSGEADVAIGSVGELVPVGNGQTDQIVVIASSEGAPLSLIAANDVTDVKQLTGKTIALPAKNGSNTVISEALLNDAIGAGKWQPLYIGGPTNARLAALAAGKAQAAMLSDPYDLAEAGATDKVHFLTRFGARAVYWNGPVFSTRKWLAGNRVAATRFLSALAKGCNYVLDPKNRAESIAMLAKETPVSTAAATDAYTYWVAGPGRGKSPPRNASVDLPALANTINALKAAGIITNPNWDYKSAVDLQYLNAAVK